LAHSVEDPAGCDAEVSLGSYPCSLHTFEERFHFTSTPVVDHTHRDVHLGVNHALPGEALQHTIRNQLVILGCTEAFGDSFEGEQEAGEIGVTVDGPSLLQIEGSRVVTAAQFNERLGRDGPFKVQMQFSLGSRERAIAVGTYVRMFTRPSVEPGEVREVCGARQ